jgi:transposase InsO family protein
LKTERTAHKIYHTRNEAKADVFDYIERFYNLVRRHSTIGYLSPVETGQRFAEVEAERLTRESVDTLPQPD